MKVKILSVGRNFEDDRIDYGSFFNYKSFSDYDVLIIDPVVIDRQWINSGHVVKYPNGTIWSFSDNDYRFGSQIKDSMSQRSQEVDLILKVTSGIVICFLRDFGTRLITTNNKFKTDKKEYFDRYSWLPDYSTSSGFTLNSSLSVFCKQRSGDELSYINKSHEFSPFFEALRKDIRYEIAINRNVSMKMRHLHQ